MMQLSRMEYGRDYGGTGTYYLIADFSGIETCADIGIAHVPFSKEFYFGKAVARAKPNSEWRRLFIEAVEEGKRMKFCCGKVEEGVCCCGGWTHGQGMASVDDASIFSVAVCSFCLEQETGNVSSPGDTNELD